MNNIAFLDMDGVIADFVKAIHRVHNRPYTTYDDPANRGKFDIEKLWGISIDEFWKSDNREFWESVEKTPEADGLVNLATHFFGDRVCILTAPSKSGGCYEGKNAWIQRHFPQFARKVVFTKPEAKQFLARPGAFLIDDKDTNCEEFTRAGGAGILVPRMWNKKHKQSADVLRVVQRDILIYEH